MDTRTVKKHNGPGWRVAVDMREFRSALPSFLHAAGLELDAVTLTVGDFILTPHICIERKSVSDLFQSMNSGRLYNQAAAMCQDYSAAALLIEFTADRAFLLQSAADIKEQMELNNICSKVRT